MPRHHLPHSRFPNSKCWRGVWGHSSWRSGWGYVHVLESGPPHDISRSPSGLAIMIRGYQWGVLGELRPDGPKRYSTRPIHLTIATAMGSSWSQDTALIVCCRTGRNRAGIFKLKTMWSKFEKRRWSRKRSNKHPSVRPWCLPSVKSHDILEHHNEMDLAASPASTRGALWYIVRGGGGYGCMLCVQGSGVSFRSVFQGH